MTILYTVLDFILMTWIFWPIILILPFVAYYNVVSAVKDDDTEFFAGLLIATIVGALAYKYPAFRGYFDGWRAFVTVIGGYVVGGFLLSLYKWFAVLWDFRKKDIKKLIAGAKDSARNHFESYNKTKSLPPIGDTSKEFTEEVVERLENRGSYGKANEYVVEYDAVSNQYSVYPNWRKYPIGLWWVYWPFFLLELPFDFLQRLMENFIEWLKHFYNGIAQKFAVKA